MVCPLKELSTSAFSASPRRLTEGVLEVEGPTSADAGVASCLLFNAEPVFRRLRDNLFEGKILAVGMIQLGGIELKKGSVEMLSKQWGFRGANGKLELRNPKAEGHLEQSGNSSTARLPNGQGRHENETRELLSSKRLFRNNHRTYRPYYIYCRRWCLNTLLKGR